MVKPSCLSIVVELPEYFISISNLFIKHFKTTLVYQSAVHSYIDPITR